jgi:hypothetical protein
LGPEFQVNTYTPYQQSYPSVTSDSSGNFVVVWASGSTAAQDGSGPGIFGQRYASAGVPLGAEFRVNSYTTDIQFHPVTASDAAGNFVVVWHSYAQDGSNYGVFGQRYASSGALLGPEFRVNTYTTNFQRDPSVAADPSGNFVVVWHSRGQDGSSTGVFGQRYASSGAPLGPEFRVNTYTSNYQLVPAVAKDSLGNFVVVWTSYGGQDGSSSGVFGQRYASSGIPLGPEFRVNTYTPFAQRFPSVAADSSGNFVVAWESLFHQDGSGSGVFGQRYASSGLPLGPEFRVNTYTSYYQFAAAVATDSLGNFIVVWTSELQDGSIQGVYGQRFANSGAPLGAAFRVNTYTTSAQFHPSVAADSGGNFIVVWASDTQDGSNEGVFGQRYGPIVPVQLLGLTVE